MHPYEFASWEENLPLLPLGLQRPLGQVTCEHSSCFFVYSRGLLAQSPLPAEPRLLFSRLVCSLEILWMGWTVFRMEEGVCSFPLLDHLWC